MAHTAKILIRDVVTAKQTDTVETAAKLMKRANIGAVVVTEGRSPIGIFTERDLLNRVVAEGLNPAKTPLSSVMTPKPATVESSEPLDRVFSTLADRRFRNLPITEQGQVVGLVSLTDIASVLKMVYQEDKYIQYFVDFYQQGSNS